MRIAPLLLTLPFCAALAAQTKSVVFTGRFDSVSLDQANERTGGSLSLIREFDLAVATPGANAIARSWMPTTAHAAAWGDGHGDANYARFYNWKTAFERFNFAGPFIKNSDRAKNDPSLFYWTIRDNAVNKVFKVLTANGTTPVQIKPGDFFRWGANGNVEFFLTQAQLQIAKGAPPVGKTESPGAGCICQDAAGNLYYSPAEGGHWVSGNNGTTLPVFCNDGGVVMIDAADITYDANGNVQSIAADKAHMIYEEVATGPNGQPSVRGMVTNAGAWNNTGGAQLITTTKMVGIELDPNGGTMTASWPVGTTFPTVPNLVYTWDSGAWGGTIFSTAVNTVNNLPGSIAVINGTKCGSDQSGVPATGAWLGVKLDTVNFQPTLMGLAIVDGAPVPFTADAPNDGAIQAADTGIFVDLYPGPLQPLYLMLSAGPLGPNLFQPSLDLSSNPLVGTDGWRQLYTANNPTLIALGVGDINGYAYFSLPNIWQPALVGLAVEFQGLRLTSPTTLTLSNPVQMQFK